MVPSSSRRVIAALSTIFLLGFLWYKRKRSSERSDPGGTSVDVPEKTENHCTGRDSVQNASSAEVVRQSQPEVKVVETSTVTSATVAEVEPRGSQGESLVKLSEENLTKFIRVQKELVTRKIECITDLARQELSDSEFRVENKKECSVSESLIKGIEQNSEESTGGVIVVEEAIEEKCTICEVVEEKCEQRAVAVSDAKVESEQELVKQVPIVQKSNLNPNATDFVLNTFTCSAEKGLEETVLDKVEVEELITEYSTNSKHIEENCSIPTEKDCTDLTCMEVACNNSTIKVSSTIETQDTTTKSSWDSEIETDLKSEKATEPCLKAGGADDSSDRSSKPAEMARESSSDIECEVPTIENGGVAERQMENEPCCLESKLSALELSESRAECTVRAEKTGGGKERQGVERDSANHSPADVMLESPSVSNYSDAQSEGSSDSGKGGSDVATPPSRTPASGSSVAGDLPQSSVYEFVLPQILVGRLIGRHGIVVHQIKAKTNANIFIKRHPETATMKICAIEGTPMDIESALEMIRQKFPEKRFPNVTLEQVSFLPPVTTFPLASEYFQLPLIEGVNNDVIVSSLVTPEHCFLQQPTHPTYLALSRLNMCMNLCYNEPNSPVLPLPVKEDVVCVAPTMGGWFRAQVVTAYPENETCDVRFLDYGGYLNVAQTDLRQIRQDFLTLPFQAAECYLANVKPMNGVWVAEALTLFEQLTHGQVIQAQIHGYADNGIPVVYLFSIQGSEVVVVNQELVSRGYAELYEPPEEEVSAPVDSEVVFTIQQEVNC